MSTVELNADNQISATLNAERYNDLLRAFLAIKDICNDVDMREGIIRQRSNDKTSIFEIDLTPLFEEANVDISQVNIAISAIKDKIDLLKAFAGQEVEIVIEPGEGGFFSIADEFSLVKFVFPSLQFMDNKYMTRENLNIMFETSDDDLILEYDISNMMSERIKVITSSFHTDVIQVKFEGEEAIAVAATQAKDQFAEIIKGITMNKVIEGCSVNLSNIPFGLDHDTKIEFKMYKDPNQDISLNTFTTSVGVVQVSIFTRSAIISDND